ALRKPFYFHNLVLCYLVRHDRNRWHPEGVEPDHIIEAFHYDDATAHDGFPETRLNKPVCVLSKKFLPTVKIDWKFVLVGLFFFRTLVWRQGVEGLFLAFKLRVASDPRQKLAFLTENWIKHLTTEPPTPFVTASVLRQNADSPFIHHPRR